MKVVTLTDKEEKLLMKLIDQRMKSKHSRFEGKQKNLTEQEIIRHNKKMANLSLLKDKLK
jgi:hypothetical protein